MMPTEVTFEFRLGEKIYRVRRRPTQDRPRKRGEGMVTESVRADLWRLADENDEEGSALATQATKVTEALERLLGLRVQEFRQVVVLPQGGFDFRE